MATREFATSSNAEVELRNRCLDSKSPYVRSHAKNPTAWQLWDPETLDLARKTNRLLFVSIGYSACHWCHVMADESFNNHDIAKTLNDKFVPIKIDREERPDIDRVYMDFLQATMGGGGWPLNVFVTPDLQPIYGGTYWPGPESERSNGGGGFAEVLERVIAAWENQEARCRENAGQITAQLKQFAQEGSLTGPTKADSVASGHSELPEIELLEDAYEHYRMRFDSTNGGFGGAPKFPTPAHLSFLLKISAWPATVQDITGQDETKESQDMVIKTLRAMANGGIKDQVGHGFSRYSVTKDWSLPHFEKMLYDNAQLLSVYLDAYLITKDALLLDTVHDIATYLSSPPIQSPKGGFNSSEDADSAVSATEHMHKEGAFYVWSQEEFTSAIGDDKTSKICEDYYGIKAAGNVSARHDAQGELTGKNTLKISMSIPDLAKKHAISEPEASTAIATGRAALLKYRDGHRPRPGLDDKIVVSWNGLAISALARTAAALSHASPDQSVTYLTAATSAASFIKSNLYSAQEHTLLRVYREGPGAVPGFADDYAHLIAGLLDLYTATFDESYLEWAYELQRTQLRLFFDHEGSGGFFSTASDAVDVLIRSKDAMDNAEPSTNGVSAVNLFRLAALLSTSNATATTESGDGGKAHEEKKVGDKDAERPDLHALAVRTLLAFDTELTTHPGLLTTLLSSVVIARLGIKAVTLRGTGPKVDAAIRTLREGVWPGVVVLRVPEEGVGKWLQGMDPLLEGGGELVQVCEGTVCRFVGEGELVEMLKS